MYADRKESRANLMDHGGAGALAAGARLRREGRQRAVHRCDVERVGVERAADPFDALGMALVPRVGDGRKEVDIAPRAADDARAGGGERLERFRGAGLQLRIELPLPDDLLVGNIEVFRDDVNDVGNSPDVLDLVRQIDGRGMLGMARIMLHGKRQPEVGQPEAKPDILIEIVVVPDHLGFVTPSQGKNVNSENRLRDEVSGAADIVQIGRSDHDITFDRKCQDYG